MGEMPGSMVTVEVEELKITSSPATGAPVGAQLPLLFQLPDAPPDHILVAAFANKRLNRNGMDSKNLFML